ncbi:PepSY domain-containing protein [Rhodococcus sp. NPDC057014]|uniref:PepSY domain-containing protein n=1 Tax=Rhodococcus sp. NPDC057014 TaxID=3346000 RepID=UPI0036261854
MTSRIVRCASLIPIVAASALLLGGCGSDSSETPSTSASATMSATAAMTSSPTATSAAGAAAVTKEQAEQTALATVPGGTVVNSEQQQRDGKPVWHVHIRDAKGWDYDVNVDAATGTVVSDSQDGQTTTTAAPAPPAGAVTQQQAEQIALATVPGGTVANSEQQQRDGKPVWHIHIRDAKGWDYDINVDEATGAVLPDN